MRLATTAVLALLSLPLFADPPDAATIDGWIKDLANDDAEKRDEAEKKLVQAGAEALPKIQAEIGREGPHDSEADARLKRVVAAIDRAAWWEKTWKDSPIDLANDYVKDRRCGTCNQNRVPFNVVAIETPALAKRFPDIRFFALDWICCQDRPEATLMLVVGKTVDVRFEIGGSNRKWAAAIAPYVLPVKTPEEARETASLLVSVTSQPGEFDAKVIVDTTLGKAETVTDGFIVTIANAGGWSVRWEVTFDKAGKLTGIEAAGG